MQTPYREVAEASPRIEVITSSEVMELHGNDHLEAVTIESRPASRARLELSGLFIFTGARPHTGWLADAVALDRAGFVLTGAELPGAGQPARPLESSMPGVFAVGDVRSGSTKRVAAAVGEGAMVVRFAHQLLAHLAAGSTSSPARRVWALLAPQSPPAWRPGR